MKLNKIIYDIRESLSLRSDDSEIDNRYISYLLGLKRAKYLRQDLNNFQRTTDITVTQTFCSKLVKVSASECLTDFSCEFIYRTEKPIPKPIELHIKSAITSVKPVSRTSVPFSFITKQMASFALTGSAFPNRIYAFLDNDMHIYLISSNEAIGLIDCLTITGIFEDPLLLSEYSNCCNCENETPCFDEENTEYPLQPHYVDLIKLEIVKELSILNKIEEDEINNSDDDKK